MEKLIWEKGFNNNRDLSQENMTRLAKEAGLNMDKYKRDVEGACKDKVRQDQMELAQVGVRGTPAFYINGRFLSGARPFPMFKEIIDEELKKANERIAQGTPVAKYYETWVLEKGEKRFNPN